MSEETYDIELCVDCGMWLANAEEPISDGSEWKGISAKWDGWHLVTGNCVADDCECIAFTMAPCDGCGSSLGGSRYHGAAWQLEKVEG